MSKDAATKPNEAGNLRIGAGWDKYRLEVIPIDASRTQVEETRNGFYAGAWHLLACVMSALEPGTEPTDADLKLLDEIQAELQAFAASKRG